MKSLLEANIALQNQTQATLATVKGRLRVEIINYEIQAGAEAARADNVAGEEQAITAASAVGGQTAANQVIQADQHASKTSHHRRGRGHRPGRRPCANAEKEIGVPYVWGGETPGVGFDCSGLVQWAWDQAGISIPRTTETQWPDMLHVTLTELQPGDLLFYYNLDGDHEVDHVVMYVGSGPWGVDTTIAARPTPAPTLPSRPSSRRGSSAPRGPEVTADLTIVIPAFNESRASRGRLRASRTGPARFRRVPRRSHRSLTTAHGDDTLQSRARGLRPPRAHALRPAPDQPRQRCRSSPRDGTRLGRLRHHRRRRHVDRSAAVPALRRPR